MMKIADIPPEALANFREGCVIPALPLALHADGSFDETSQRAILRYYLSSGVGGVAVGVHSTQFTIRDIPGFFEKILKFSSEILDGGAEDERKPVLKIAGICGVAEQATGEAALAVSHGYHAGLVSLSNLAGQPESVLLDHVRRVSGIIPVVGFYLQPAVGGIRLSYDFWKAFAGINNVLGVKIAPFNRYATVDVLRGVADSGRAGEVSLYTGNDDNIVVDLLTPWRFTGSDGRIQTLKIVGGLLGHWGVWTSSAVSLFYRLRQMALTGEAIGPDILTLAQEITDMNGALFDAAHNFAGSIPGIHEVLHRQGLMESPRCLNPEEVLSPGQAGELDRVCLAYPHLTDDDFIREHLDSWRK
ncbi:MAG: dihydrodipicolinate synthase family protein [Spirochaetes bacterium]|nr:MAG: dihydrodipicolinate synthase family protein [Spirochaetota bacterium]RKX97358.1 MAG: dihydrodipicolinate synthase family protein [Spirochaetota bacterium]